MGTVMLIANSFTRAWYIGMGSVVNVRITKVMVSCEEENKVAVCWV